jgi:hypothetical protein
MRCQNGSCHYRRFNTSNNRYLMVSRWFYDSLEQRCRRYNHHLENFVYFRYRRDCKRACPIIRQRRNDRISNKYSSSKIKNKYSSFLVTLHVSESPPNYNDTVYVHLQVDLSPEWVKTLSDSMNISTQNYYSQTHYFQSMEHCFSFGYSEDFCFFC